MEAIKGIGVSSGIAIGRALKLSEVDGRVQFGTVEAKNVSSEIARMDRCLQEAKDQIVRMRNKITLRGDDSAARIFDFHLELLGDSTLIQPIRDDIQRECVIAEYAVAENFKKFADQLRKMGSEMFVQKAIALSFGWSNN